jgi:hypothetical protein
MMELPIFDTYFLKRAAADDETLHFHEMIHIVQWRVLGAEFFLAMYAGGLETFGYRNSRLKRWLMMHRSYSPARDPFLTQKRSLHKNSGHSRKKGDATRGVERSTYSKN